jgi:hypothetical protein
MSRSVLFDLGNDRGHVLFFLPSGMIGNALCVTLGVSHGLKEYKNFAPASILYADRLAEITHKKPYMMNYTSTGPVY